MQQNFLSISAELNKGRIRIEPIHLRQGSTCVIRDGQRKVMSLNYNP